MDDPSEPLLSISWYRVAGLRPRLRAELRVHRHVYRGQIWQVLQEPVSGRCHRLSPAAQRLVGLMDGTRTVQEIWDRLWELGGDDVPTQDETIALLGRLHAADLLSGDVPPDTGELLRRHDERAAGAGWRGRVGPLSQRVPLWDPDRFLARALPWAGWLFSPAGAAAWCALVGGAAAAAFLSRDAFTAGAARDLLEPRHLLLMALVYPVVKSLHELAHGLAARRWGGEVHEMGVVFLVFLPVPYVDASSAAVFPDKWRRAWVGAAGIAAELAVAALALLAWLALEAGVVRALALAVITTSGLSTLLFNGNPLLRYDGYYVLADLLEIPNLDGRARQLLGGLVRRHAFGLRAAPLPHRAPGETPWLVGYGVAALLYRPLVTLALALWIGGRFPTIGLLLAALGLGSQLALPLARLARDVLAEARAVGRHRRAALVSLAAAAGTTALLFVVPFPDSTRAQGVVWPPERAEVRAGADGFVVRLLSDPDTPVRRGDALVEIHEPVQDAEIALLEAQRREVEARRHAEQASDVAAAEIVREELATLDVALAHARERAAQAIARSESEGTFVVAEGWSLVGRYVRRGDVLGYVLGPGTAAVRVAVQAEHVADVRDRLRRVEVRLSRELGGAHAAEVARIVPGAIHRLPSAALGAGGGGPFAVAPEDESGLTSLDPFFVVDLTLPSGVSVAEIGGRAYVRFEHAPRPLGAQGWRALRRLFLQRIGV